MQFQLFKSQEQFKENFSAVSGDIGFFDDAFDTDSLKKFYRQQVQPTLTVCTSFAPLFAKSRNEDFDLDEASSPSIDERETQASPLTRYISKFSQETSSLGVNLDYQFYGEHDPIYEANHASAEIARQPVENLYAKSAVSQSAIKLQDCKPITYPQLNMSVASTMLYLTKCAQPSLTVCRKDTQSTDCSDTDRSPTGFEKLFQTKKIFKIQRDTKPRAVPKQKAASSPKMKPVKIPASKASPPMAKVELSIQPFPVSQDRSPVKTGPAPVMSFLNIMQEKGYTPEQVMSEIQRFVHNPQVAENFSAKKN